MILDNLSQAENYYGLSEGIRKGLEYLKKTDFNQTKNGVYELDGKNLFVAIMNYDTKDSGRFEAHEKYIDIQYIISGRGEKIGYAEVSTLGERTEENPEKDIYFYDNVRVEETELILTEGMFAIFMPQDGHKPGLMINSSQSNRKAVVKVMVS